jgi:hypothetical protein
MSKLNWNRISDKQLIKKAQRVIEEKGIKTMAQLKTLAEGPVKMGWASMSDGQLVVYAKNTIREKGLKPLE